MTRDAVLGAALLIFGIATIIATSLIPVRTFAGDPGPHLFPHVAAGALILCGISLGISSFRGRTFAPLQEAANLTAEGKARAAVMFVSLVALGLSLWLIGFYITAPLGIFGFYWLIAEQGSRSVVRGAIYALATYAVIYVVFVEVLNSFMPTGFLF